MSHSQARKEYVIDRMLNQWNARLNETKNEWLKAKTRKDEKNPVTSSFYGNQLIKDKYNSFNVDPLRRTWSSDREDCYQR